MFYFINQTESLAYLAQTSLRFFLEQTHSVGLENKFANPGSIIELVKKPRWFVVNLFLVYLRSTGWITSIFGIWNIGSFIKIST